MTLTTNLLARFRVPILLLAPALVIGLSGSPARAQDGRFGGEEAMRFIDAMRGYLEIIDRYSTIAHDPGSSGVAAVVAAGEIFRNRSHEEAITFFNKMLTESKNEAVQRAIRIQLADLYRSAGQTDKALEQLQILITSAPPEPKMPPFQGPGGGVGPGR